MMRSLYAGVSGLQNHQLRTDVIGNNIANINTNGFKRGRVNFQDMISQTMQGASKPVMGKGGTNPKQVGLGMTVASIDQVMSQGSMQVTGKKTDLGIQGEGFFVQKAGEKVFYTRAGNFGVDRDKNLVNPGNGYKLQGWNAKQDVEGNFYIDNSRTYEDIRVPMGEKFEARETKEVVYKSNLDSRVEAVLNPDAPTEMEKKRGQVHFSSIDIYDRQGNVHKLEVQFVKVGVNQWQGKVNVTDAIEGSVRFDVGQEGNVTQDTESKDTIVLNFNNRGALDSVGEGSSLNPDLMARGDLSVTVFYRVDDGTVQRGGGLEGSRLGDEHELRLVLGASEGFDGLTQMGSPSTTKGVSQDGYSLGYLESFNINEGGILTGIYSNGQVREIAQVSLATFVNGEGLEKVGENVYMMTNNSGLADVGEAGLRGKGKVIAGVLEMSNVDLSEEFTNMIVTQRGFQANSRIITTSDQMLQELLTLKR